MMSTSPPTPPHQNTRPRKERRLKIVGVPRNPIDEKAIAKVLVDRILRELDEAAGITPKGIPLPPGEKYY